MGSTASWLITIAGVDVPWSSPCHERTAARTDARAPDVRVNKHPFTILGVAPPAFQGTLLPARLYVSLPILEEYADVLSRPELRIRRGLRLQLLQLIKSHSHILAPSRRLDVCTDKDDNVFLECAGKAVPTT